MPLVITISDPAVPETVALLEAHLELMRSTSPPESVHALDIEDLRTSDITFWTVHDDGALVGCGALKVLDDRHGEVKSMHVRHNMRGRGIAAALVEKIIQTAIDRGFTRLSLETGSTDHFIAARRLYARYGFLECGPFADYVEDWHSTFMTKVLTPN